MTGNYKMNSLLWLDCIYTIIVRVLTKYLTITDFNNFSQLTLFKVKTLIIVYFTGCRAHEWVTKIKLKHVIFETLDEKDWDDVSVKSKYIKISPEWRTKVTSEKTKRSWGAILKIHGLPSNVIQPYDILSVC